MKPRILILHSGPTGSADDCALCAARKLHEFHHEVLVVDLSRYLASHVHSERTLLICLECAAMAPEVLDFVDYLGSLEAGSLSDLQYSVLSIERAARRGWNQFGRQIDGLLEKLGARRLAPRMDCGAQFQDRLHVWVETVVTVLALKQEAATV